MHPWLKINHLVRYVIERNTWIRLKKGGDPAVLRHPKSADGKSVVEGKSVTGFTNTEEAAVGLTDIVPFLVEDMLASNGGNYSKGEDWHPYVLTDGLIIYRANRLLLLILPYFLQKNKSSFVFL